MFFDKLVLLILLASCIALCEGGLCYVDTIVSGCILKCENLGWNDGIHPGHIAAQEAPQLLVECRSSDQYQLQFTNCSFPNQELDENWFGNGTDIKFMALYFYKMPDLKKIASGAIGKYPSFQNNLENFQVSFCPEMTSMTSGILEGALSSKFSNFFWTFNGILEHVEVEFFSSMPSFLHNIQMVGNGFANMDVIANITGKCQFSKFENLISLFMIALPSGYGIPVFGKDLFSAIQSSVLETLYFNQAGIEYFEDNRVFEAFTSAVPNNLQSFKFYGNKLTTIPVGLFEPLIAADKVIEMHFYDNQWHCDGNLQYFQDILRKDFDKLHIYAGNCASPESQAGVPVVDANLSGDFVPIPLPPPLNIKC